MSKKRTNYSSAFKTKLVLELLQNEATLAEIASKHNILPQNLVNWKKTFLANAEIAMEPSKAVKEYKEELIKSQEQNERLTALVGKVTVEKEWLAKKLVSLGSSKIKQLVELKPSKTSIPFLSVNHQCQLLGINRSGLYYKPRVNRAKQIIKNKITKVFEQIPIYGEKKVHQQLLEDGHQVSLNTVARYRQELGLQAVLAVKQVNTTMPIKEHEKHSYKLRGLNISRANQVWSIDGANTSQFENHVRAITGMPLGDTTPTHSYCAMINIISKIGPTNTVLNMPNAHLHLYDKEERANRKLGHINITANSQAELDESIKKLKDFLP